MVVNLVLSRNVLPMSFPQISVDIIHSFNNIPKILLALAVKT